METDAQVLQWCLGKIAFMNVRQIKWCLSVDCRKGKMALWPEIVAALTERLIRLEAEEVKLKASVKPPAKAAAAPLAIPAVANGGGGAPRPEADVDDWDRIAQEQDPNASMGPDDMF